ncbi:cytochrome c4 [Aurantiacibacter zhengii]|uniref:Cytochrome c4 n=1 Tax=Aurantiacibacter zhengii TaxID=2307003 RepID=A0A418NQ27_9SPHN|nr:cytochrome c4 [Aurantiacibacter zhengii]
MSPRSSTHSSSAWTPLLAALLLASCNLSPVDDRFDDSGELIALSGSDAGPQAACHTCHGLDGGGNGDLVPRIAGMDPGYIVRQLGFYADGQRQHPQMSWLADRLSSEERLAVAHYYADMDIPVADSVTADVSGDPDAGGTCPSVEAGRIYQQGDPSRDLASCASCHGTDGTGVGQGNPSLVGQSAAYHAEQLSRWRSGERYGDPQGVMHDAAAALHEDEITPLSEYIAYGLGPTGRPGSRAECL